MLMNYGVDDKPLVLRHRTPQDLPYSIDVRGSWSKLFSVPIATHYIQF